MRDLDRVSNFYSDDKVIDACSIFGMMDTTGKPFSGKGVIKAIANMHFRGNGLGGGFAVYGLYPEYPDYHAFHIMYLRREAKQDVESFLKRQFRVIAAEEVPTKTTSAIVNPPLVWRYFLEIEHQNGSGNPGDDYVVEMVMKINLGMKDAFVFSSGKNMAVFKGWAIPRRLPNTSVWSSTKAISGQPTVGSPPTRRAGGAGRTPSTYWTGRWCTTARYRPTAQTGDIWRSSAIIAPCRPIPR